MARTTSEKRRSAAAGPTPHGGATTGYEAELWAMADALRGSMEAAEYGRRTRARTQSTDYGRVTQVRPMKDRTAAPPQPARLKPRNQTVKEKEFGFTKSFDSLEEANAWEREHRINLALQRTPEDGFRRTAALSNAYRRSSPAPDSIFTASFDSFDEYERWKREQRKGRYR